MSFPGISFLLALALTSRIAFAGIEIHDTLLSGVPWTAVAPSNAKASKGTKTDKSNLKFDKTQGVERARLTMPDGVQWVFLDRNPFALRGKTAISLGASAKVAGRTLILPRETSIAAKLRALQPTPEAPPPPPEVAAPPAPASPPPSAPEASPQASPQDVPPTGLVATESVGAGDSAPVAEPPSDPAPESSSNDTPSEDDLKGEDGIFTVVLDAGHGGKDPGAIGKKIDGKPLQEKDATLGIVKLLRDELRSLKGIRVVLTRDDDTFLSLGERTRKANASKGDLFVSIHCNSLPLNSSRRDEVGGFMVYLLREAKSEADRAIERRENEAIRFETGERQRKDALSPVEWVMLEHQLNLYTKESERFAGYLVKNLEKKGPVSKERTGAGQAGFFVLVGALMPSVLIETGYVSNESDAQSLGSTAGRKSIAHQIARSIDEFRRTRR